MKIVLFDGIQEMHVVRSLQRSLERRGHSVYMTGKLTSGFEFIQGHEDIRRVEDELQRIQLFSPDLVIVFRPSALPFNYLQIIRSTGTRIFAWFSDDPVLWNFTYRESVSEYDVVLHCGNYKVLEFYEKRFGRATGVNFPFWTDQDEFPYSYTGGQKEGEIIFFGNVSDTIRRQRYYDLAKLKHAVTIYGKSEPDYFRLSGGYLDFNHEILDMAKKSKVSINIPQIFEVRKNDTSWFDGLKELGTFEIPSRMVQSAAMGIPMVTIESEERTPSAFRSAISARNIQECDLVLDQLETENSYVRHSKNVLEEFLRYFSADSRAMALESLMEDDSWERLDTMDRSVWYRNFDALGEREVSEFISQASPRTSTRGISDSETFKYQPPIPSDKPANSDISVVVGERWQDYYSNSSIMLRSLLSASMESVKFDLFRNGVMYKMEDPSESFQSIIDIRRFVDSVNGNVSNVIFIGSKFYPIYDSKVFDKFSIQFHLIEEANPNNRIDRIVGSARVVSFLNEGLYNHYKSRGNTNVRHVSDVFEPAPTKLQACAPQGIKLLVQRRGHLALYKEFVSAAGLLGADIVVAEDYYNDRSSERLYSSLASRLTLVLPDPSRPDKLGSKFISRALQVSDSVGFVRGTSTFSRLLEHKNLFMFSSVQEMLRKSRNALNVPNHEVNRLVHKSAGVFTVDEFISIKKLTDEGAL